MKVISRGTPPSERIWSGTCRNCGSIIEALESELTNIEHDQREASSFSWEVCPVCNAGAGAKGNYGGVLFYPRKSQMKVVYFADDGRKFNSEAECLEYEQKNNLHNYIVDNMTTTFNEDAGFGIIEVDDVVEFLEKHFTNGEFNRLVHAHLTKVSNEKS